MGLCLLLSSCAAEPKREAPVAVNGVIDLSDWDFERDGPVELKGEWRFAFQQLVQPSSYHEILPMFSERVEVPGIWTEFYEDDGIQNESSNQHGVATYLLKVLDLRHDSLVITGGRVQSASKLWLLSEDGKVLSSPIRDGEVGDSAESARPCHYSFEPFANFGLHPKGHHVLVYQISNYSHYKGGIWAAPSLGLAKDIHGETNRNIVISSGMVGIFLVLALYHLTIFYTRRSDRAALWFALLLLTGAFRELMTNGIVETLFLNPSRATSELLYRFEYFSMSLIVVYGLFLNTVVHIKWAERAYYVLVLLSLVCLFLWSYFPILRLLQSPLFMACPHCDNGWGFSGAFSHWSY